MLKLHLGCGKRNFGADWRHIDKADFAHIDSYDVTKLPYVENSVDLIYASHLIAYFDRDEIVEVLKEWKRVLKPAGILRLATPDFKAMAKLYIKSNSCTLDNFLGPLYGKMGTPAIYHKTTYDLYSLIELLASVGFTKIRKYDKNKVWVGAFDDHSCAYMDGVLISLNIQCYG